MKNFLEKGLTLARINSKFKILKMISFKIEDRRGWVALPEKIGSFSFPLSFGSKQGATNFPFRSAAERAIKKYNLGLTSHIEMCENEEE